MTDTDGNAWFRDALDGARNRGRATVEAEPDSESAASADSSEPKVPDLGQGARGPLPAPPPSMSDIIRGSVVARRALVADEIEHERQYRTRGGS